MRNPSTLVLLLLLSSSCATVAPRPALPANFGEVENGLYRGAQPHGAEYDELRSLGVRTIVKLNTEGAEEEKRAAERLGIKLLWIPLKVRKVGTLSSCADDERVLAALIDPANRPLFVHCHAGRDRTGYVVGLYRERNDSWTYSKVEPELAKYGHRGAYRRFFPNITRGLANPPHCSP